MEILFKGKYYELVELKEPNRRTSFDIVAIFESCYTREDENNEIVSITKEEFEGDLDAQWRLGKCINYFYGASERNETIIDIAKEYIKDYLETQKESQK